MILGGFPEQLWRSRPKRVAFLLLAFLALATIVGPPPVVPPPLHERTWLTFTPVALDAADPAATRAGALRYLEGWEIAGESPRFGGLSALHVADGEISALSDFGTLVRFPVPGPGAGRALARLDALPAGPGPALPKSNRDTESLWMEGPWLWAGFERHNMIWRYRRADLAAVAAARPPLMRRWWSNSGPEAMARLADGRFLVFAERSYDGGDESPAVLFAGDPADPRTPAFGLRYRRPPGHRVTDAAVLPDGRLLVLNRRFGWFDGLSAVLTVVDPAAIREGAVLDGREIARLEPPLTVDNMEGLSVTRENGRTIVWLVSDDNLFPLQRTLLLKFALVE